jgi:hypothetical protein
MIGDLLPNEQREGLPSSPHPDRNISRAQQTIYGFLLDIVKQWPAEEVLLEFKRLFLYHVDSTSSSAIDAVYDIVFSNREEEFRNTLKRACYILVNNWDAARRVQPIKELIAAFNAEMLLRDTSSPSLKRLNQWVENFKESQDFADLKLFVSRYDQQLEERDWSKRFTSYLLVPQYINLRNPIEQREAARALAKQLRHQFKMDLAMYVARTQSQSQTQSLHGVDEPPKNPTALGDDVLRLVKMVVAKRGNYSYLSLANIFLGQVQNVNYAEFKRCLQQYLIFSVDRSEFAKILKVRLAEKLDSLYKDYEGNPVTDALILRTCNRMIDFLTTENRQEPSSLFVLLLSQGTPMTLVVALLKIILVSRNSRLYLEARIADLIRYYESFPEKECWWVVNFLEIFNVTFTIYAENVQYNLIRMDQGGQAKSWQDELNNLDAYRVFSQLRLYQRDDIESAIEGLELLQDDDPSGSLLEYEEGLTPIQTGPM